jgi:glycosyltransferase involved in cell wall biosynthesis
MISVLLPTLNRVELCLQTLRSLQVTAPGAEVCLVADGDPTILRRAVDEIELPFVTNWRPDPRTNVVAWNTALEMATRELIVFAADDLEFCPGWLEAATEQMQRFDGGWGMVGFNDGHWGAELATHYLLHRRFICEVLGGRVAWPCYRHSFNDLETNDRAKLAGRYSWAKQAHVLHRHWLFGDRPQDSTDVLTLGDHSVAEARYRERAAQGFPNDWPPVIEC